MCWALVFVLFSDLNRLNQEGKKTELLPDETEYVSLILDFSPSMLLTDGGQKGEITRKEQMKRVVDSLLERFGEHVRFSLIAFYTRPMPMVTDAQDKNIVSNVLNELPIERVMGPGKTELGQAIKMTLEMVENKPEESTTLVLVTDGDTPEIGDLGYLPVSIKKALVLGVGNSKVGLSIDGHMSRQEPETLAYVANHLQGTYLDVNASFVPGGEIHHLIQSSKAGRGRSWNAVDQALAAFILSACLYSLLPLLQQWMGSSWTAINRRERSKVSS